MTVVSPLAAPAPRVANTDAIAESICHVGLAQQNIRTALARLVDVDLFERTASVQQRFDVVYQLGLCGAHADQVAAHAAAVLPKVGVGEGLDTGTVVQLIKLFGFIPLTEGNCQQPLATRELDRVGEVAGGNSTVTNYPSEKVVALRGKLKEWFSSGMTGASRMLLEHLIGFASMDECLAACAEAEREKLATAEREQRAAAERQRATADLVARQQNAASERQSQAVAHVAPPASQPMLRLGFDRVAHLREQARGIGGPRGGMSTAPSGFYPGSSFGSSLAAQRRWAAVPSMTHAMAQPPFSGLSFAATRPPPHASTRTMLSAAPAGHTLWSGSHVREPPGVELSGHFNLSSGGAEHTYNSGPTLGVAVGHGGGMRNAAWPAPVGAPPIPLLSSPVVTVYTPQSPASPQYHAYPAAAPGIWSHASYAASDAGLAWPYTPPGVAQRDVAQPHVELTTPYTSSDGTYEWDLALIYASPPHTPT